MTDEIEISEDELTVLKARADLIGLKYHPSIGLDALKTKFAEMEADEAPDPAPEEEAADEVPAVETPVQLKLRQKQEATRLVRVRITCMNPNKKDWEGEIFTTGNAVVGSLKKYVPYDVEWHVPQIILNMIEARQCQVFHTVKENGTKVKRGKLVKEFAVAVLPDLTQDELKDLAQRQAMANGTSA